MSHPTELPFPRARDYRRLAYLCFALVVYFWLTPFSFRSLAPGEALARFFPLPLFPPLRLASWRNGIIGGVLVGLLTFSLAGALVVDRHGAGVRRTGMLVVFLGWIMVLVLEFLQVYIPDRVVSANDLASAALGSLGGVLAWRLAGARLTLWLRRDRGPIDGVRFARGMLVVYLLGLGWFSLQPFDFGGPEVVSRKLAEGRLRVVPFAGEKAQLGLIDIVRGLVRPVELAETGQ